MLLWVCLWLAAARGAAGALQYATPQSCLAAGGYLDIASLACARCGANQSVGPDGLSCGCQAGFRLLAANESNYAQGAAIACVQCASGTVVSQDGRACLPCDGGVSGGACVCGSNDIVAELNANGTLRTSAACVTCASGYVAAAADTTCSACPAGSAAGSGGAACACPSGTVQAGDGTCVAASYAVTASASNIYYADLGTTLRSAYFDYALVSSTAACASLGNRTACQQLANLCVVQTYAQTSTACASYLQLAAQQAQDVNGWAAWPASLPWLYYTGGISALADTGIALSASLSSGGGGLVTNLPLLLASYALNGTFLGWVDLGQTAQLCPNRADITQAYANVGLAYTNNCVLNLTNPDFVAKYAQAARFFDPYLLDTGNVLYPIPVLVTNYQASNGVGVNSAPTAASQLTRRFFLFDNTTGQASSGAGVLRIASSITLSVSIVGTSNPGRIYPPLLQVTYTSMAATASSASVSFQTQYSGTNDDYRSGLTAAAAVCAGLAFVAFVFQMSSWRRRNKSVYIDFRTIIEGLAMLASAFSTLLVAVLAGTALYWLIYFRREQAVESFLPSKSGDPFVALLVIALLCKLFEAAHLAYRQTHADVFFIDWEQPPATLASSSATEGPAAVSIWRTLMIANEWHELVAVRKTSIAFQLLFVLFLLYVADASNLGSSSPPSNSSFPSSDNYLLRFATISILYLLIGLLQWVFYVLHSRFVEDKLGQFIDLCSVCNVSVFILSDDYFGFYLHGRSVHGCAEVDMWQMRENFRKEEANMTGHRGLLPNSNQQAFEIHVPVLLREQLDAVLLNVLREEPSAERAKSGPSDKALHGYITINRFLCAYIDHSFRDLDYVVQNKLALASLLDLTPDVHSRGVFYTDTANRFAEVLLLGRELSLFLLDFLVFTMVDFLVTNYVAAAAATYVVQLALRHLCQVYGRRNLAQKTMVDERFLI